MSSLVIRVGNRASSSRSLAKSVRHPLVPAAVPGVARVWLRSARCAAEQLPPEDASKRYVEMMGGANAIVESVKNATSTTDLRWAAQVLDHVVFAEPDHRRARALLADTLEKLGFGIECGTWRSAYLSGAQELRTGNFGTPTVAASQDMLDQLTPEMFFDALAVQIEGPKAWTWTWPSAGFRRQR